MTLAPLTQHQRLIVRETMGWLPAARGLQPYGPDTNEWEPEYACAVARCLNDTQHAAALLQEFHFPLSVALAVLTNRHVDILI